MRIASEPWIGAALSDEGFVALAQDMLATGDSGTLANILALADRHPDLWIAEAGQALLIDILAHALDLLAAGQTSSVLAGFGACPADLAGQAFDMLLAAFFPDGEIDDPAALDDAALLCLAILLGSAGRVEAVAELLDEAGGFRADPDFILSALVVRNHFTPPAVAEDFKPKLIVWDLDDTLWRGTLADGDVPILDERRAGFIRAFNTHGIVSAICSKNDFATAQAQLEAFGLWDDFVFPRIAFVPKGDVVRQMIADMQLRPANVLFIDDNPRNLNEVAAAAPGISVIDATSPECDALLQQILDDHRHIAKSRIADYRILETRVGARQQSGITDAPFLLQSAIEATTTHRMDNLDFADRIEELINRSNQLNYTQSRVPAGAMRELILNVSEYDVFSAFVWDRYGYYGLVGVAVYDKARQSLIHFAFSCRIMHMGVEDFLLQALAERYPRIDLSRLHKPLPAQSSAAIASRPFENPEIRARILAEEAPRDWSKIDLRLMCDCQSGAFHHYSRFRDAIDFDNIPRLFSLPMMLTGAYTQQQFPAHLVYTPATDYMDWRWHDVMPLIDPAIYLDAVERFCAMIVENDHKLLLFLPPENVGSDKYDVIPTATAHEMRDRNRAFNRIWRDMATRYPEQIRHIDLGDFVGEDDMVIHAYHYVPSILEKMAGMIDDWYEAARAVQTATA